MGKQRIKPNYRRRAVFTSTPLTNSSRGICSEPRLAFNRIVVVRYRMYLESRHLPPIPSTNSLPLCAASLMKPQTRAC